MAFLDKTDLASAIYGYQVDQITEGNDEIVYQAIEAAIQEVKSFLSETLYDTVIPKRNTNREESSVRSEDAPTA
jgi:hypothetical protein